MSKNKVTPVNDGIKGVAVTAVATSHSGPLPSPDDFDRYNQILPGAAERILKMAENQQEHRMTAEKTVLNMFNKARILGLYFAFIIFLICLMLSFYALYLDKVTFAVGSLLVGIVGATVSFITGKPSKTISPNDEKSGE